MTRISITLPRSLQQQLVQEAALSGSTVSELVREYLKTQLASSRELERKKSYEAFKKMRGKGGKVEGDPNVSGSIDEILYGENGAWRGSDRFDDE